ncbi:hypothetical protein Tco_0461555 [Tanacetum coccineum]
MSANDNIDDNVPDNSLDNSGISNESGPSDLDPVFGLDDVYQPIRSNILTREPFPLVKTACAVVLGEESHMNVTSVGSASKAPSATAFVAKGFDNKNSFKRGPENNKNPIKREPKANMKPPSFVLVGRSPYSYVYGRNPRLSHFRLMVAYEQPNPKRLDDDRRASSDNDVT